MKKNRKLGHIVVVLLCGCFALTAVFAFGGCVKDELAAYKSTAKAGLDTYAVAKGEGNYSAEKWAEVLGFVAEGKTAVDAATDKPGVDAAVATAKGKVDAVLTKTQEDAIALSEYKAAAKAELEAYAAARQEHYTPENWVVVLGFVADGKTAIDAATTKPAVDTAVETAEQAIEDVPQKEEPVEKGIFYSLEEAYSKKLLTVEDLQSIASYYNNQLDVDLETMDEEIKNAIKQAYIDEFLDDTPQATLDGIFIENYYGTYNRSVAVGVNDAYYRRDLLVIPEHIVGGVSFFKYVYIYGICIYVLAD